MLLARKSILLIASVLVVFGMSRYQPAYGEEMPRVFSVDARTLSNLKGRIAADSHEFAGLLTSLYKNANFALKAGPFSVVNKPITPPSGDKHDYLSLSRYWWPNPDTPDGLPYVRRDGQVNPDDARIPDEANLTKMISAVNTLALAYYFKGDEVYAAKAVELLRAWFIDEATRMNPNLKYSQVIPGQKDTQHAGGIVSGRNLSRVMDSVGLLVGSPSWTTDDQQAIEQWFTQYLQWLTTSPEGLAERSSPNNLGTWYDVQVASIALFIGQKDQATSVLMAVGPNRIATQIEPDGRQPRELGRANAWDYSVFNLQAFFQLATIGDNVGIDVWGYQTTEGTSIRKALDYLVPFAVNDQPWPFAEITDKGKSNFAILLRQAAEKYHDSNYLSLASTLPSSKVGQPWDMLIYMADLSR